VARGGGEKYFARGAKNFIPLRSFFTRYWSEAEMFSAAGRRIKTMGQAKPIRVIKGGRATREAEATQEAVGVKSAAAAVREVKEVVSDWVRDHRQRSDEFRRNYSTLLGEMGFKTPSYGGRTA
jgi:hypothetical protein